MVGGIVGRVLFTIAGLILNVIGTCLAGLALILDFREHSQKPMLPWLTTGLRWLRAHLSRQRPQSVTGYTVDADNAGIVDVDGTPGRVTPSESDPVAAQIEHLRREVEALHKGIAEQATMTSESVRKVSEAVTQARVDAHKAVTRVEDMARGIAVGTVKMQLTGLLLIGFGTILGALPMSVAK